MISRNNREFSQIFHNGRRILFVYINGRLVWGGSSLELILSCIGNGYWIDEYYWSDETPWVD